MLDLDGGLDRLLDADTLRQTSDHNGFWSHLHPDAKFHIKVNYVDMKADHIVTSIYSK